LRSERPLCQGGKDLLKTELSVLSAGLLLGKKEVKKKDRGEVKTTKDKTGVVGYGWGEWQCRLLRCNR